MSGFASEAPGEFAIADFGLDLVDSATPPPRILSIETSRLAERVASFTAARLAQRIVTFKE
jgi:hypothetical protein